MRKILVANMTVILQITSLYASELDIASLIREIPIKDSYKNKESNIISLTNKYKQHLNGLNPRFAWTKNKLYEESISTVILSEMCRAFYNINVYKKSARYNIAGDVMEFDNNEGFKTRDKYDKSNWNYVVLMNTLNHIVNEKGDVSDKSVSATIDKLTNKYEQYKSLIGQAGEDIKQYMNDLKLYDFIRSVINNVTVEQNSKPLFPRGIHNECNTCYFNATIQMLYSSEKFRNAIKELSKSQKNGVAIELHKFFTEIAKPDKGEAILTDGKKKIWELTDHKDWGIGDMQDAEEILTSLLDRLIDDEKEDELRKNKEENAKDHKEKARIDEKIRASSTIGRLVRRRDDCRLSCEECNNYRNTFEGNNILQCAIEHEQLQDDIDEYEIIENIDGVECDKCITKTKHKKEIKYYELPEILLIQLKRFIIESKQTGTTGTGDPIWDFTRSKNKKQVTCPDKLYVKGNTYRLQASVIHKGDDPDTGHYWTEAYAKDGQAYEAEDETVKGIKDINKEDAYILMYERIDK